ncbi:MAG: type II toxin-antitoxin system prevent-host-death family antitoxin [Micrococcales bacterium]|nr:type II toxin-antitoxin system prevent-host-death family antitoxin [Micrococcales bacterium]
MTTSIGIRELQQHASRLVRAVEQGQAEYRVTVQGRDTGVTLSRSTGQAAASPVILAPGLASELWQGSLADDARRLLLANLEAGRDTMGLVGE